MTTPTATLRLNACDRCNGTQALCSDKDGRYWQCLTCGSHSYANVPPEASIRRAEADKAYYGVFDYAGPDAPFQGLRIRGRVLAAKKNETYPRFDLSCPYKACTRRQLVMSTHQQARPKTYGCKNGHRITLNLDELTWR